MVRIEVVERSMRIGSGTAKALIDTPDRESEQRATLLPKLASSCASLNIQVNCS